MFNAQPTVAVISRRKVTEEYRGEDETEYSKTALEQRRPRLAEKYIYADRIVKTSMAIWRIIQLEKMYAHGNDEDNSRRGCSPGKPAVESHHQENVEKVGKD